MSAGLDGVLRGAPHPSFLFLPVHSWHQASFQRPQQLARALGEQGRRVVYVERMAEHPWSIVDDAERNRQHGLVEVSPNVHLARMPEELVAEVVEQAAPDHVVGYSALEQSPWLPASMENRLVYDVIDHERVLNPRGDAAWSAAHARWVSRAASVLATAQDIADWLRTDRPDVLLVRNGVRVEDWRSPGALAVPSDLLAARAAPVLVYYHGILGDPWFDWRLWEACCRARPTWSFVVVGFPRGETIDSLRARLRPFPNCHYLGPKAYPDLAPYLANCDVATVPFLVNEGTHAASVIKVFEYFAAGKPVVSTPIREISRYASVLTADGPDAFVRAIERGLALRDDETYQRTLRDEAEANAWAGRAKDVLAALERRRSRS